MDGAGDYRFVLHSKDAHMDKYRNHSSRRALDLNSVVKKIGAAIYVTNDLEIDPNNGADDTPNGMVAYNQIKMIWNKNTNEYNTGYTGWLPLGCPELGGSGLMTNNQPKAVIRTLNRICPTEVETESPKLKTKNAIWAYYGHATPHSLDFPSIGTISNDQSEFPSSQYYKIQNFNLGFIRLAYLAGCGTAGGSGNVDETYNESAGNSIAKSFNTQGAKTVIGFRNLLMSNGKRFGRFNRLFWEGLTQKGLSVSAAVNRAMRHMDGFINYYHLYGNKPEPVIFGDRETVLFPPGYGNEN